MAAATPCRISPTDDRAARTAGTRRLRLRPNASGNPCCWARFLAARPPGRSLGRTFGADLTEAEVLYLANNEWAMSAADVVWRRSKLGLRMSEAEIHDLDAYLGALQAQPQTVDRRGASVG